MAESARQRRPSMARRKKRRIGAFSRRLTFSDFDGRTNAGKYVNSIKNDLEAQIGNPSPGQQILIKLVAIKMLRCEMMYERVLSRRTAEICRTGSRITSSRGAIPCGEICKPSAFSKPPAAQSTSY
jgi:hypothetical protein